MPRDPFFPDWMYALGMPHFNLYETELFNMLFELTIITFILQFLYIELVVERRRRLKKRTKGIEENKHHDLHTSKSKSRPVLP